MTHEKTPIRVLVVDDHPVVRSGLAAIISDQPEFKLAGEAATAARAIALVRSHRPHVMLVDLSLPDMDGIDLIATLNRSEPGLYFLVLTTRTGGDDINRALQAGAHAYLFKDTSSEELVSAIRTVAQGGRYVPPMVGRKAEQLPNASGPDLPRARSSALARSRRQQRIHRCSAWHHDRDGEVAHEEYPGKTGPEKPQRSGGALSSRRTGASGKSLTTQKKGRHSAGPRILRQLRSISPLPARPKRQSISSQYARPYGLYVRKL